MSSVKRKEVGSHLEQANMETFLQIVLYFVNVKQIIKVLRLLFSPSPKLSYVLSVIGIMKSEQKLLALEISIKRTQRNTQF